MKITIHLKPLYKTIYRTLVYNNVWGLNITKGLTNTSITIKSGDKVDLLNYKNKDYINVNIDMNRE